MSRVFWDSNLFVYLFEDQGPRGERVSALRERMRERGDRLFTSALTLGEILLKPIELGSHALAARYERALPTAATILPFSAEAAPHYARIRAGRSVRAPDAIQLACAAAAEIDLFITNDDRLSRVVVAGIHFVTSLERAFL
jgi:uncharacterized protein